MLSGEEQFIGFSKWVAMPTLCVVMIAGCVSDEVGDKTVVRSYQEQLAEQGPQRRLVAEGRDPAAPLGLLKPLDVSKGPFSPLRIVPDPNTGRNVVKLTIEQAIARTLSNSPEIRVVSFDPEIVKQEIAKAAAEFDPTAFSRVNYEDQDNPENSIFEPGRAETRLFESGLRQRTVLGSEWSASYALSRIWDDLFGRTLPTRYEPVLIFQLKQPLLRDAWQDVNLAGVNIAKLNHRIALSSFRDKAESISTGVILVYWRLVQARRDLDIQRQLLEETMETLAKVKGRREIDATDVQIKQAEAYAKAREGTLLELEKRVMDIEDVLARLMADPQINTTSNVEIVPVTVPEAMNELPDLATTPEHALATAMQRNSAVQQANTAIEIADINIQVAKNQRMPRLDLVTSARTQGLAREQSEANDQIVAGDYASYAVGLNFEFTLGDRQRYAELRKRRLERRKAISTLHNVADQVATQVKERIRKAETNLAAIAVQREAVQAAGTHLHALEESEPVRARLTPEFLLVKLQAQETYARAQRAEISALVELNIALAELAQAAGTVFDLHAVEASVASIAGADLNSDDVDRDSGM